ncbi:MAG: DALR domain-containing protein, partial [Pyrinomonadaceae bacterium]
LLSVPTRKQLNFTFEGLQGAESTVERLRNFRSLVTDARVSDRASDGIAGIVAKALTDFEASMDDDFNTAAALAAIHDMVREINSVLASGGLRSDDQAGVLDAIKKFDSVLGIFGAVAETSLDSEIEALIEERQEARRNRDFARSDEIRDKLAADGIILEDTPEGVRWRSKL